MDNINRVTQKNGMRINVKKTKVMCISRQGGRKVMILIDVQKVERRAVLRHVRGVWPHRGPGGPEGVGGPAGVPNALGPRSRAYVNNTLKVYLPQRAAR